MFRRVWNKYHVGVFIDACKYGDGPQVLMMLEKEPELAYLKDKKGISALFHSVANGHDRIADALLRITKQPDDVESEKGFTPLLLAATDGHTAMVRLLLKHGANPNMKNFDGVTALHNAVFEKQIDIVKLLLEYGADPTIKDRFGNTPIDLAQRETGTELLDCFKDRDVGRKGIMLFKPKWYSMLPEHLKPKHERIIESIESLRKKYELPHEMISIGVATTPWAVRMAQEDCLRQYRYQMPNVSEKELWENVLLSRMLTKQAAGDIPVGPWIHPLSGEEILSMIDNRGTICANFKTWDDVVEYIVSIERYEGTYLDPSGILDELNILLESDRAINQR